MSIRFFVDHAPCAQPRHKVTRNGAYIPSGNAIHAFKGIVAVRAREAMNCPRIIGPVAVSLVFVFERPKTYPRSDVLTWHAVKPDIDNLEKSVLDALKGIVYTDDSQIVSLQSRKVTADSLGRISAGVYVIVTRCEDDANEVADSVIGNSRGQDVRRNLRRG